MKKFLFWREVPPEQKASLFSIGISRLKTKLILALRGLYVLRERPNAPCELKRSSESRRGGMVQGEVGEFDHELVFPPGKRSRKSKASKLANEFFSGNGSNHLCCLFFLESKGCTINLRDGISVPYFEN